jgi:uncharacterized protein YeaO (DUF488 family)
MRFAHHNDELIRRRTAAATASPRNPMSRSLPRPGVKRVYEPPEASDGVRVLVDRIWPRGLTKEGAAVDVWLKDIAPSTALESGLAMIRSADARFINDTSRSNASTAKVTFAISAERLRHIEYFFWNSDEVS